MFEQIIALVKDKLARKSNYIFVGKKRLPIMNSFKEISKGTGRVSFVDSGWGCIINSATIGVYFVRLYRCCFENNVRTSRVVQEGVVAVSALQKGESGGFEVLVMTTKGVVIEKFLFDAFDPVLCSGTRRAEVGSVAGYVRKVLEFRWLEDALKDSEIVVRDGDLEAQGVLLERARESLSRAAQAKNAVVLGLAKTCSLVTDSGVSAIIAIQQIAPKGVWVYDAGADVVFVKLQEKSKYVFRCDVINRGNLQKALGVLVTNSCDPQFLGYPYGLLDADRFAQVSNEETAQLRVRLALKSGELVSELEVTSDAHDILNSF